MARLPKNPLSGRVPKAEINLEVNRKRKVQKMSPSKSSKFALSLASVVRVDYVTHEITLRIFTGEDDEFQRTAVTNSYPAAGARHFMGALPEPGDVCVVGYFHTDTPCILSWWPISATAGLEWLPTQDFLATEVDMSPKTQTEFEGIYHRQRHKMRAMNPGDIFLSSSKGSDIFLDEGVLITNRRANEIRLRDQDQAIVFRSLQQFHATSGTRVYSGMVQRDASLLPSRMFSDGIYWDAPIQATNQIPIMDLLLGESPVPSGALTPHEVFFRSDPSYPFNDSGQVFSDSLDPYGFLQRGLFIGPDGYIRDGRVISDAEYGGKPLFRVAYDPNPENPDTPLNSAVAQDITQADTLTEYRIELDHTSDGRLPVNEQTDGLDVDRLPSNTNQGSQVDFNRPFIEFVLGSVVGNDPFSKKGRLLYGIPLVPRIFDVTKVDPRFESGLGVDLGEHAAFLLQVTNPLDSNANFPTFISLTKDGRLKSYISGPQDQNSVEIAMSGGLKVQSEGPMEFISPALNLKFDRGDDINNFGFAVETGTGAIKLSANGPTTQGSFSARMNPTQLSEQALPSLLLEAPTGNAHLVAGRITKISGANAVQIVDTNEVTSTPKQSFNVFTDKFLVQCNTLDRTVQGRENTLYSGPKNFLPTNLPVRKTIFAANPLTGHAGGTTDEYFMLFGDREERFLLGNHKTAITVGNLTYQTGVGTYRASAGTNVFTMNTATGIGMTSLVGGVRISATQTVSVRGVAGVQVVSNATTNVSGLTTILGGVGGIGGILNASDIDPLSGFPFGFYGIGSPGHLLGPPLP
jgi:hypothetical protein